ncbi:unnamed protein product, partial [Durusdinium trenchii]
AFERIRRILRRHGQEGGDDDSAVSKTQWEILGKAVCVGAWKLLAVVMLFRQSISDFLKKGIPAAQSRDSDTSRARIISFLRQLYESVAETLPDVRDDSYEFDNASVVLDIPELSDPYAEAMSQKSQDIKPMADSSVRGGKRKIRKKKRSVVISSERKAEEDRYLPTKHFMADTDYNFSAVYFPYEVARVRLPLGLPTGVAPRKEIPEDFKQQLLKAMPGMRKYGLESAAIYLEQWLQDSLPLEPLLDISACAAYPEQPSTGDLAPSVQDLEPEPGLLLAAAKDDSTHAKHYVAAAKRNIVLVAAACAWRHGVPWDEAYELCDKAIQKASAKLKLKVAYDRFASWLDPAQLPPNTNERRHVMFSVYGHWFVEEPQIVLLPSPLVGLSDMPIPDAAMADIVGVPVIRISLEKFGAIMGGVQSRQIEARTSDSSIGL